MGFPQSSVGKESACNAGDSGSIRGLGRSPGEGIGKPLQYSWASLVAQLVKNPPAMRGDLGSIPGLGRSPGEGKGYPLQYPGLENSCVLPFPISSALDLKNLLLHLEPRLSLCWICSSPSISHKALRTKVLQFLCDWLLPICLASSPPAALLEPVVPA